MDRIAAARARLARAIDLPCILDAAYGAFDGMLPVIHHQQDPAGAAFTAFVMAAAYAANGRDAIGRAPSLPPATPRYQHDEQHTAVTAREAATALTELSQLLSLRRAIGVGSARIGMAIWAPPVATTRPVATRCRPPKPTVGSDCG